MIIFVSMKRSAKNKFLGISIILISLFLTGVYYIVQQPNILIEGEHQVIHIKKGIQYDSLKKQLQDEGFVSNIITFDILSRIYKYDRYIKPGAYLLAPNMNNLQAVKLLRSGAQTPVRITFNNARTLKELSLKICRNIDLDATLFYDLITNTDIQDKYGFTTETMPCMFIPNTYEVYRTVSADDLLDRMKYEYDRFWTRDRKKKAKKINLTRFEVSTLASIVRAESIKKKEYRRIAGVYVNRIRSGIPLQADPTLVFALGDFTINRVLNEHKKIKSPYNTYKNKGLPPGPINLPPVSAIDAVLSYEAHKYIYFCAKEDFSGYHNFATNLRDHNNNARRYQNALNRSRIYR